MKIRIGVSYWDEKGNETELKATAEWLEKLGIVPMIGDIVLADAKDLMEMEKDTGDTLNKLLVPFLEMRLTERMFNMPEIDKDVILHFEKVSEGHLSKIA